MRRGSTWARSIYESEVESRRREEERDRHRQQDKNWRAERAVLKQDTYKSCYWCGMPYGNGDARRTKEHVVPKSRGGGDEYANIMYAHRLCNSMRGSSETWVPFHVHRQRGKVVWA